MWLNSIAFTLDIASCTFALLHRHIVIIATGEKPPILMDSPIGKWFEENPGVWVQFQSDRNRWTTNSFKSVKEKQQNLKNYTKQTCSFTIVEIDGQTNQLNPLNELFETSFKLNQRWSNQPLCVALARRRSEVWRFMADQSFTSTRLKIKWARGWQTTIRSMGEAMRRRRWKLTTSNYDNGTSSVTNPLPKSHLRLVVCSIPDISLNWLQHTLDWYVILFISTDDKDY